MEELLEKYLLGTLSDSEKQSFEARLKVDKKLAQELKAHQDLMEAAEIKHLKMDIESGWLRFRNIKIYKSVAIVMLVVAALTTILLVINSQSANRNNENHKAPLDQLPSSEMQIHGENDTVLETSSGIVIFIPSESFVDENNQVVNNFELRIKEALTPYDIMKSGLQTMSDSSLLETAGMFKIEAFKENKPLKVADNKELTIQVPTKEIKPDMMLFDGVEVDGNVNWVYPKKMVKYLIPQSFDELNFYPLGYLNKVAELGLDANNKSFTDSLYYSFDCQWRFSFKAPSIVAVDDTKTVNWPKSVATQIYATPMDSAAYVPESDTNALLKRAICPASIRALQTPEFEHTYIATKEFAQRLQWIFKTCDESLLNVYVKHLDKDLWYADSIVATKSFGNIKNQFEVFAQERLTNTRSTNPNFSALFNYHQKKKAVFDQVARNTQEAVNQTFKNQDRAANDRRFDKGSKEYQDYVANYEKEFEINLKEACRQAGITETISRSRNYYTSTTGTVGWKNIDQYVARVTMARKSARTIFNGKKVELIYHPLSVKVEREGDFDFVKCYLVPDELVSFQRLVRSEMEYTQGLNNLLRYQLVCIGEKGGEFYIYVEKLANKPQQLNIALKQISEDNLKQKLNELNKNIGVWSITQEYQFEKEELIYRKQVAKRQADQVIRRKIEMVIWPCGAQISPSKLPSVETIIEPLPRD